MSYLGSKAASGVYQKIIAEMPPHDTYIETHLGGGAVMLRKPPAMCNIGIDVDGQTLEDFAHEHNRLYIDLVRADAVDYLNHYDFYRAGRVLIYADPPYLHETRTGNARYRYEYSVADHERLLSCLVSLPKNVSVILSGYPSQLYDERLTGWRSKEFQAMTRGGVRTEKIWMNYQEGRAYSHAFAGKDYNDRYRIKRKVERWRAKYASLPPTERLAIMVALNEVDSGA
ncbi:DNA adenine methylase [Salmonella enterica subsp. enterica serovar Infantis]|uniref:DNA methylase n=3 Tax=root TaxID=1 RepID=A0A0M4S5U3_9CAUD|nr:DNA methyltransferase [Salmonella phage SEN5]YP_009218811.1 DNA methyltransferase [Salmonella phage SEN4]EAR6706629.1 DNA adenine methylase [Salmonella enterica]EBH3545268.1 DNA adenine methylase [Salmonella enterica subsp. enterica serovar Infantis]EBO2950158.1 DNA adenine methylase [Salmonella enterica subsp. enterica serovar Newport]EBV6515827.1 DNA adenine methylase [Salmonella enterica subsp. enterica serovar Emek]ECB7116671.1 DNA adenine methylase [Salmonella enterica subsp. enterica